MRFSSFPFSLECYKLFVHVIISLRLQRLSLKTKEIFFIKVKTLLKTANLKHAPTYLPHGVGRFAKTPPKCIYNERRQNYHSHCSIFAAADAMSWRRCVSL